MEHEKDKNYTLKLDQFHNTKHDGSLASGTVEDINPKIDLAQTFSVNMNGSLKEVHIDVQLLDRTGTFLFDIRPTNENGVPLETNDWDKVLFHKKIPWDNLLTSVESGYIWIDLGKHGIPVAKGDVLALVLRCDHYARAKFNGNTGNQYAGGRTFTRYMEGTSDNSWLGGFGAQSDWDIGFRTYIK
ncbi:MULTISPECIES: hypothetical protein [Desulfosediminicola]|uniref:hypothetical protein n=1 Tax=Desulfosediminicola TaxID=2886823 RepID=UPI0010AC9B2B|nr:hypothetical protein [Desulfosediminicola ganghwensis]